MKKIFLLLFMGSFVAQGQILILNNTAKVTVKNGASIDVNGLKLTPSTDYDFVAENSIDKSNTAIGTSPNVSITRVYNNLNVLNGYAGTVTFYYEDAELNGITEADLVLAVKDQSDVWTDYTGTLDTSNNTITYLFASAINFKAVTAKATGTTLNLKINPRILLQGPYDTAGTMFDDLRSTTNIPTTSPYVDVLTCDASVFNVTGNNAIVDWVWVELRDEIDNTVVIKSTSALLQRDGDIVDFDGVSLLIIDVPFGNYYLMISHRNHIGILTSSTVSLAGGTMSLDLTGDSALVEGGTNGIKDMGNGRFALFAGDYNGNGQVQNSDVTGTLPFIGLPGYENADIDMNGQVQNTDILNMIYPNIGKGEQSANRRLNAKRKQ